MTECVDAIVGSLAHDERIAIAAIARADEYVSIGIDIEPWEPLSPDYLELVATDHEQRRNEFDPLSLRLLFAAKEAVYKATFPIDQQFLDHHDVEIDFLAQKGLTRYGKTVEIRTCVSTHIVALAFVPVLRG
jgi:4'-phosphopantetheinyl transferase EntD